MTPRFTFLSPRSAPGPSASIPIVMRAPTMWSADLLVVGRRRLARVRLATRRAFAEIGGTGCDVKLLFATRCSADPGTEQRGARSDRYFAAAGGTIFSGSVHAYNTPPPATTMY